MKISREVSVYTLLAQFRNGFQRIQRIGWVSPSGLHLSMVGLVGFACGLILTLRGLGMGSSHSLPWSSEGGGSPKKKLFVPGLRNLGNNCFLNVILQALASCVSFRLFLDENAEDSNSKSPFDEQQNEGFPLSAALIALFEELCMPQDRRKTLNPRSVMSAMNLYIPHFQLTNQQDAAEAILHLLSCLREEFSESYIPNHGSLADMGNIATASGRIVTLEGRDDANVPKKWKQRFIGPFDGILSSFLICQSCSTEILMDFEFFHTLSLSPMVDDFASIVYNRTLEDCLKKFLAAERVENYHCSHCWHLAAIKYLSSAEGHEEEKRKLSCCSEQDSCDCRNLSCLQVLQWSDRFSHTVKQLSVVCCPKILCLHIQRASMNIFGEPIKVQGHVSFPMMLDLSPFVNAGVGIRNGCKDLQKPLMQQYDPSIVNLNSMQTDRVMLNLISSLTRENKFLREVDDQRSEACSDTNLNHMDSHDKVSSNLKASDNSHKYHLLSVVEHFGRSGSGHYTVYRGAKINLGSEQDADQVADSPMQWFCVSDSLVHPASEEEVLAAHATLLFYERI